MERAPGCYLAMKREENAVMNSTSDRTFDEIETGMYNVR